MASYTDDFLLYKTESLSQFLEKVDFLFESMHSAEILLFPRSIRLTVSKQLVAASMELKSNASNDFSENGFGYPRRKKKMQTHGLTGESLQFKLQMFDAFFRKFVEKGGMGSLNDVLDIVKSILGSLASAYGILSAITELIDMIQKLLGEQQKRVLENESAF